MTTLNTMSDIVANNREVTPMALSDYEKEVLAELEAEFASDKSEQGASTHRAAQDFHRRATQPTTGTGSFSPRRIALGLVIALAGIVGLLSAVTIGYSALSIAVGVCSFLIAVVGLYYAIHRPSVASSPQSRSRGSASPASRLRRFMDGQQRRWDERER